jgi:hypothetical protein
MLLAMCKKSPQAGTERSGSCLSSLTGEEFTLSGYFENFVARLLLSLFQYDRQEVVQEAEKNEFVPFELKDLGLDE